MRWPENPVLAGCYPDPSATRVGDDYYLVTSTFEYFPGLPIFHSTDGENWLQVGHALDRVGQLDLASVPSSGGLFAPTLRHHDGTWYLTCTLVHGTGKQGNFVLTADDPAGPWSDPHWLDDARGIDPSLFFDDDGRAWFCATRLATAPLWPEQTEVWLREFDLRTLGLTGDETVLWTGALTGAVWAEGPHLYRRNGWYYLLASEGGTEINHAVSVARSRSITGPYSGHRANPVLTHRNLGRRYPVTGVGHSDLVETADGDWFAVLLASRSYDTEGSPRGHANLGRETFMVAVEWEDDWPVFAPGTARVDSTAREDAPSRSMPASFEWTQVRTGDPAFAAVDPDAARVTLRPSTATLADLATPSFLGIRQHHRRTGFRATLRPVTLGSSVAGLAVRQSEAAHLQLLVDSRGTVTLSRIDAGGGLVLASIATSGDDLELEVVIALPHYEFRVTSDSRRTVVAACDGSFLSSQEAGGFLGTWLGLVAVRPESPGDPTPVSFENVSYGT